MVTQRRWSAAQDYERTFWQAVAREVAAGCYEKVDFYPWRAEQLVKRLRRQELERLASGAARVLEIGGGPVGVVAYFPAREAVAIDPLEDLYAKDQRLAALRMPHVSYRCGVAEELPFEPGSFDLVIIENCVDHVKDPDAVLREIHRVLAPSGVLYLTVNCRMPLGYVVHRLLSRLRIDRGHPHTFTPRRTRRLVERAGLKMLDLETESFARVWKADLMGPGARSRLKALLGVSEFVVSLFAARNPA